MPRAACTLQRPPHALLAYTASPSVAGGDARACPRSTRTCGHMRAHAGTCCRLPSQPRMTRQRRPTPCVHLTCLMHGTIVLEALQQSCVSTQHFGSAGRPGRALLVPGQRARLAEALQSVPQVACAAPRGSAAEATRRADLPRQGAAPGRPDRRPAPSLVCGAGTVQGSSVLGGAHGNLPQVRGRGNPAHRLVFQWSQHHRYRHDMLQGSTCRSAGTPDREPAGPRRGHQAATKRYGRPALTV